MKFSKKLTTVTPLSKAIAMVLFISLPFIGFAFGIRYANFNDDLAYRYAKMPVVICNN